MDVVIYCKDGCEDSRAMRAYLQSIGIDYRLRTVDGDAGARTEWEDLELDTADLASAYLGAFDFNELAGAERVHELKPGALQRATDLFRTSRPPYCPEDF
jgi:hypothetical protein